MGVLRVGLHLAVFVVLTALTQRPLLVFGVLYLCVLAAVQEVAPRFGRVPIPCDAAVLREQSLVFCALMRNFVVPDLKAVAEDAAARMAKAHPGTVTLALDGGFPFVAGFPLLPHLSHDDGQKLDLAFYYRDAEGYQSGQTRSPLGNFAFDALDAAETCPPVWATLRWRLEWLQGLFRDALLDRERTAGLVQVLLADPRVGKVFLEPALAARLGLGDGKLRFQGCRAARHDDHVHVQS